MTPAADGAPLPTEAGPARVVGLLAGSPDAVACWRVFTWDLAGLDLLRRELEPRVERGAAPCLLAREAADDA